MFGEMHGMEKKMDIQSSSAATTQSINTSGRSGSLESAAEERKAVSDSEVERKEVERSSAGNGIGEKVDIEA